MASWLYFFSLFLVICTLFAGPVVSDGSYDDAMKARHEQWMAQYKRVYTNAEEKQRRFQVFKRNVEYIESSNNKPGQSYNLTVNQFADLTNEEFMVTHGGLKVTNASRQSTSFMYANFSAPPRVDWRLRGAVTEVKNQGSCGKAICRTISFLLFFIPPVLQS